MLVLAFIATIFLANWAITLFGVVPVGFGLVAPAGVYCAGLAFTLRDLIHERYGRRLVLIAIVVGAILSGMVSSRFAIASGVAFLVSELADFVVYDPLRRRSWIGAIVASNIVGFACDSVVFLWLAFGSLSYLSGQLVGKAWMTALFALGLWTWTRFSSARIAPAG